MLWVREATSDAAQTVLGNLREYYTEELNEHGIPPSDREKEDSQYYLQGQMNIVSDSLTRHNFMQMGLNETRKDYGARKISSGAFQ